MPRDDTNESPDDVLNRLPADLRQRARQLFDILLRFIIQLLFTEKYQEMPAELKNEYDTRTRRGRSVERARLRLGSGKASTINT